MKLTKYPIYLWALFDLITIGYVVSEWVSERAFPFQNEILYLFSASNNPEQPLGGFIAVSLLILELSVFFSAYYLIRQKKEALYVCYPQSLLRLFLSYSSIPFLNSTGIPIVTSVIIISTVEYLKLLTLFAWHIYFVNDSNIKEGIQNLWELLIKFKTLIAIYLAFEVLGIFINYLNLYLVKGYHFINIFSWRTILALAVITSYFYLRKNIAFQHITAAFITVLFLLSSYNFIANQTGINIQTNIFFMVFNVYFITAGTIIAIKTYKMKKNIT